MSSIESIRADAMWESNAEFRERRRQMDVIDRWDNAKEELDRIESKVRDLLDALTDYRRSSYFASDVAAIDAFACDVSGPAHDLLSNLHATHLKLADEAGLAADMLPLDLSDLSAAHDEWEARWSARKVSP